MQAESSSHPSRPARNHLRVRLIAHRISTIRSADPILVVESGEIRERGRHEELIGINARFKQLYEEQYRFEQNLFVNPGEDFTTTVPQSLSAAKL